MWVCVGCGCRGRACVWSREGGGGHAPCRKETTALQVHTVLAAPASVAVERAGQLSGFSKDDLAPLVHTPMNATHCCTCWAAVWFLEGCSWRLFVHKRCQGHPSCVCVGSVHRCVHPEFEYVEVGVWCGLFFCVWGGTRGGGESSCTCGQCFSVQVCVSLCGPNLSVVQEGGW